MFPSLQAVASRYRACKWCFKFVWEKTLVFDRWLASTRTLKLKRVESVLRSEDPLIVRRLYTNENMVMHILYSTFPCQPLSMWTTFLRCSITWSQAIKHTGLGICNM